ncbi:hypothetical protein HJG60_009865 [Phyllostomus discolor]|uniref:Uncharacterized protein n=1 Tax=Phyllostomus discolor TaxID=89673 RepID=A0A834BCG0_9CHIR|nr:hypothetical protein HJG60_009865 [Phyllostomus discolor]
MVMRHSELRALDTSKHDQSVPKRALLSLLPVCGFQCLTRGLCSALTSGGAENLTSSYQVSSRTRKELSHEYQQFLFLFLYFKVLLLGEKKNPDFNFLGGSTGPERVLPGSGLVGPASDSRVGLCVPGSRQERRPSGPVLQASQPETKGRPKK